MKAKPTHFGRRGIGSVRWEDLVNLAMVRSNRVRSTLFLTALVLWVSLAGLVGCSKEKPPPPPPPEVTVTEAVQKDVPIYIELVGSTLGSEDVEIRARV